MGSKKQESLSLRLQSECDMVIRYYRSTVIPGETRSRVLYIYRMKVTRIEHVKEQRESWIGHLQSVETIAGSG